MKSAITPTDTLVRGLFPEVEVRFGLVHSTQLANQGLHRHPVDLLSGWILGETLTLAALMGVLLKGEALYTLRWDYPGPMKGVICDVTTGENGVQVRGFIKHPQLVPMVQTLEQAMGDSGTISVIDSLPNRVVRQGITEAVFMDTARDLAHFLSLSFQTESALALGMGILPQEPLQFTHAQGLLLQPLPNADPEEFDRLRLMAESMEMKTWLEETPRTAEEVATYLNVPGGVEVLGEDSVHYQCRCNREKLGQILQMHSVGELEDLIEEGGAEAVCHFCAEVYRFSKQELSMFLSNAQKGTA